MKSKTLKISIFIFALASFTLVDAQERKKDKKPNPERMFKHLDADANGSITFEEFKAKRMKNPSKGATVQKRFSIMDADGNGSVNLEEFSKFIQQGTAKEKK